MAQLKIIPAVDQAVVGPHTKLPTLSLENQEDQEIAGYEKQYGIPTGLYERLIRVGENSGPTATSPAGAYGRAQLMPAAAAQMGVNRYDPHDNLKGGAEYLAWLHQQLGDWDLAVAAYNDGIGNVKSGHIPESTREYTERVTRHAMPETATADTSMSATFQPGITRALGEMSGDEAAYKQGMAHASAVDKELADRMDANNAKIEDIDGYLKKLSDATPAPTPEAKLPGYAPPQQKNPLQALAMAMPLMLLAGSKMGRNKGLALMKTMSGMLKGVGEGNDEVRKQYQEDFKAKVDAMVQQATLDHDKYMEILESLREHKSDALSQIETMAAETQNDQLRHAALTGDFQRVADLANIHSSFLSSLLSAQRGALESEQNAISNRLEERQLQIEQQKADETARYHEEQSPLKRMQAAEKLRNDLDKSPLGKAYATLDQYEKVIDDVGGKIARGEKINAMEQSAFLDAYTKVVTGGQAIRSFTLRLNTEHAGLADKAQVLANQFAAGGALSDRQMKDAVNVIHDYSSELTKEYEGAVSRADQFAERYGVIDQGDTVMPFEVDPARLQGGGGSSLPSDLPPATGHKDGSVARDESGNVVAVIRNGQWVAPS